jgi:hypothetical protein
MNEDAENRIKTLEPGDEPTAAQLIGEIREAIVAASAMDVWSRLSNCHNTRRCLWANKQPDGRLPAPNRDLERNAEKQVWRWPGAPDVSVPLCDEIVRWLMLIRAGVVNRGDVRIAQRRVSDDASAEMDEVWQNTMDFFLDVGSANVSYQTDLFSTTTEEFGYGMALVEVEQRERNERLQMDLQAITDALVMQEQDALMQKAMEDSGGVDVDPAEVLTPEAQTAIAQKVQEELEMMLASSGVPQPGHLQLVQAVDPNISDSEAKSVLRQLRKGPVTAAEYTAPRDDGCMFRVEVLVPWVNCIHPNTMTGEGETDMVAVVRYYSESKVNEKSRVEKWNKAATKKLIDTQKNQFFTELCRGVDVPEWSLNGMGVGLVIDRTALEKMPRWLVVYVYRKITNKAGLPMVYRGALHPSMPDDLLFWEITDLTELPLVVDTAEPVTYAMLARGAADIIADKQNLIKDTMDGEGARGQMGSNPPLMRTAGQHVGIRPGIELYAKRSGNSYDGSQFMQVPVIDQGSLKMMELLRELVNAYYFRGKNADPEDKAMFREWKVFQARRCHITLLHLIWVQMQEKVGDLQVSNINGRPVKLDVKRDQLKGEAAISIGVHVDGYGTDAADKFAKTLGIMMQNDRGGAVDWNEAMMILARLLTPTYASRLVQSQAAASGKIVADQNQRITQIMAGVPVDYEDKVSNPQLRMKVLQRWAQMPGNVQRAQADPTVAEMMQKEQEQLIFQEQQIQNAATGRAGVKAN